MQCMEIDNIEPGKYVVAVSGGVDSIVLLDLLSKKPGLELVVAHYDHGIRKDSNHDLIHVQQVAKKYELEFHAGVGRLGLSADAVSYTHLTLPTNREV